jgi:prepilin-type N-terminal cleavage/methylation domain-containing protein
MKLRGRQSGFTIVELLIVIVVIAILAAITIVAYNGVQQRAKNSQTISAANAWYKVIKMYKAEKGVYPTIFACLGEGYKYGPTEEDTSGQQCRQDNATSGLTTNATFNAAMQPYISNFPSPAMVTAYTNDTLWKRGLMYYPAAPNMRIDFVLAGSVTCPPLAGINVLNQAVAGGNTMCHYVIGTTTE